MKLILKIFLLFFATCQNTMNSEGQNKSIEGEYSGTFSVTYKSYKNSSSVTQTGKISILFRDSTYSYSAVANYSSDITTYDSLSDRGYYSQNHDKILLNDMSWLRMDKSWHSSLYFEGIFDIYQTGEQVQISQENTFAKWHLIFISHMNN